MLCSNTPFPHNVFNISFISRFSALMAIDLEDIGFFRPEVWDLDPGKSRGRFDFMQALVAIVLVCHLSRRSCSYSGVGIGLVRKSASRSALDGSAWKRMLMWRELLLRLLCAGPL